MTPSRPEPGAKKRGVTPPAANVRSAAKPRTESLYAADPAAERAALALWGVFVLLALLRALLPVAHSMGAWSLNLQRFLAPLPGWGLWAMGALALLPPVARRLNAPLARLGDAATQRPLVTTLAWMAAIGLLVWSLPDAVRYVGDFLLRQGSVEELVATSRVFPQALPLDGLLHYRLPAFVADHGWLDANGAARLIGALEAALLAAFAVAFARTLALRGAAAIAAIAIVVFGGYLGIFTGYGKAFTEMVVLTAAIAVYALRVARTGRGFLPLGVAFALGVLLHRSALGFVPTLLVAWSLGLRGPNEILRKSDSLAMKLAGIALPLVALAFMLPRILHTLRTEDVAVHFASADVRLHGGLLGSMFMGTRPLDFLNLLVLLSPAALALPVVALVLRRLPGRREATVLVALALPFAASMLLIHPASGLARDWDDFAAAGVAFSLVAAWLVGATLTAAPRHAWVGAAVAFAVALPAVQWLVHHTDLERGLRRVEAFVTEPPRRSDSERATTWDYLGVRNFSLEHWGASATAFARAAETGPSPRILVEWAMAETQRGDLATAQRVYRRVLDGDSTSIVAWRGLAAVSSRMGEFDVSRRAANRLLTLDPTSEEARAILDYLDRQQSAPPAPTGR
jgi:hypothetical protein